jgi:nicotinate-nucleotide pyrophosphorylase
MVLYDVTLANGQHYYLSADSPSQAVETAQREMDHTYPVAVEEETLTALTDAIESSGPWNVAPTIPVAVEEETA